MTRTTLAIDDDVLAATRALSERAGTSMGEVLSELARRSLRPPPHTGATRNGVPLFPLRVPRGSITSEMIQRLEDEDEA